MQTFLTYFNIGILMNVAVFVGTLLFSQKIKDFINGVPSHVRVGLSAVEANVLSEVKAFSTGLVDNLIPAKPPASPVPPAPVA